MKNKMTNKVINKITDKQKISLVWKYFWQQKAIEIGVFLLIISSIIFIPYFIGLISCNHYEICYGPDIQSLDDFWAIGLMWSSFLLIILGVIFGIYSMIKDWINSNWQKANRRVEEEYGEVIDLEDIR